MSPDATDGYELGALVIQLQATRAVRLNQHMGRAIHELFFRVVGEPLASYLHDAHQYKPFSVSGFLHPESDRAFYGHLQPGARVWIRLTATQPDVIAALEAYRARTMAEISQGKGVEEEIDRMNWQITDMMWEGHPWSGLETYEALLNRQDNQPTPNSIGLEFVSATTFRSYGVNTPLPVTRLVFSSLHKQWAAFTGEPLWNEDTFEAFLEFYVLVSRFDIETTICNIKNGGRIVGFEGPVSFSFNKVNKSLLHKDEDLANMVHGSLPELKRTLAVLADFAFYTGVGRKTTTGMGMVRSYST